LFGAPFDVADASAERAVDNPSMRRYNAPQASYNKRSQHSQDPFNPLAAIPRAFR
jgi:hypothetical protein